MRTVNEIVEELFTLLDCVAGSGALLPEELEQFENLRAEFYIQNNADK